MNIDIEFLEALPAELRGEILAQHGATLPPGVDAENGFMVRVAGASLPEEAEEPPPPEPVALSPSPAPAQPSAAPTAASDEAMTASEPDQAISAPAPDQATSSGAGPSSTAGGAGAHIGLLSAHEMQTRLCSAMT